MATHIWRYLPLLLLLGGAVFPIRAIEVFTTSGLTLLMRPACSQTQIELSYVHSVEKIPVVGRFMLGGDGRIQPVQTWFPSFGPGLPFEGAHRAPQGGFSRDELETPPLEEISLLVSPEAQQVLRINGSEIELHRLGQGQVVRVRVRKYPLVGVILGNATN